MEFVKVEVSCEYQYNLSEQDVETHKEVLYGLQQDLEDEFKLKKDLKVSIQEVESDNEGIESKIRILLEFSQEFDGEIFELRDELESKFEGTKNFKVFIR